MVGGPSEGLLWLSYFALIVIFHAVAKLPFIEKTPRVSMITRFCFSLIMLILIILSHDILNLSWSSLILIYIGYNIVYIALALVFDSWSDIAKGIVTPSYSMLSWFMGCLFFFTLGFVTKSTIWFIGSMIIFTGAIVNVYFEKIIKPTIEHLNPDIDVPFRLSGFALPDEFPAVALTAATSFLYFPTLYYFPKLSVLLQSAFLQSGEWQIIVSISILFGGFTTAVIAFARGSTNIQLQALLAKVYVGFLSLGLLLLVLSLLGTTLERNGHLDLERAFSVLSSSAFQGQFPPILLIFNQLWFASLLVLIVNVVCYAFAIIHLVMGGRRWPRRNA